MQSRQPLVSICIPHWQVRKYMTLCLRSLRKHSRNENLEIIVVDNGSRDDSLDYLRSLDWIRLIERPEEVHTNWPLNVFTAWDRGLEEARGTFYLTMHSDVFIREDGWLDPFLREMEKSETDRRVGGLEIGVGTSFLSLAKTHRRLSDESDESPAGTKKTRALEKSPLSPRLLCACTARR